jgi:hypothetical protein
MEGRELTETSELVKGCIETLELMEARVKGCIETSELVKARDLNKSRGFNKPNKPKT